MKNKHTCFALLICLAFYLFFNFKYGVVLCADSNGYINMISAREPVYPLFLALFRKLIGEGYLYAVILVQNLLFAFAVWISTERIVLHLHLQDYFRYIFIVIHFGVALLCQYGAKRSSIYSNCIMTEGLAMSCYILLFVLIFEALYTESVGCGVAAMILSGFMMDIRKQMAIGFIITFAVLFFGWIGKKGYVKRMASLVLALVIGLCIALVGTRIYNYCLRGEFAQNTRDMNLVLTTSLYVSDREDAELIEDEGIRELFVSIYDELDSKKALLSYAGTGWREVVEHYGDSYDVITIDTTANSFIEYAIAEGFEEGIPAETEADRVSKVIVSSLLKDNIKSYSRVYFASVCEGLINTVAKRNAILDWYGLAAYAVYIVLMILCLGDSRKRNAGLLGMGVLIGIVVNVGVTAALIFCQTRYMIYNMALFYIAGIVMLSKLVKVSHRR